MKKGIIVRVLVSMALLISLIFIIYLKREDHILTEIKGDTMGSTYSIKYVSSKASIRKHEIDSILLLFNQSLSTYSDSSEMSEFNRSGKFDFRLPYFYQTLLASQAVYEKSNGAFDPSIGPLISRWNIAKKGGAIPVQSEIDSIKEFVGFSNIQFDSKGITSKKPGLSLNFNAIAPGVAADVIGQFLQENNIEDYMIEVGGEVLCRGNNHENNPWRIGIEDPIKTTPEKRELIAIASLKNKALATSGNYRSFFEKDGIKYGHTIDPRTGWPASQDVLSASVFAPSCAMADGIATAIMVLGMDGSKKMLLQLDDVDVYLVYLNNEGQIRTFTSYGMREDMEEVK